VRTRCGLSERLPLCCGDFPLLHLGKEPNWLASSGVRRLPSAVAENRAQFYKDVTLPLYGYNRPGAKISEGIRCNFSLPVASNSQLQLH
jgi:hypothetical protein